MNTTIFIAVIGRRENLGRGAQHAATFTNTDKDKLIHRAVEYRRAQMNDDNCKYSIFIGTLTERVQVPVQYRLVEIEAL